MKDKMKIILVVIYLITSLLVRSQDVKTEFRWKEFKTVKDECSDIHQSNACSTENVHWHTIGKPIQKDSTVYDFEEERKYNRLFMINYLMKNTPELNEQPNGFYVFDIKIKENE